MNSEFSPQELIALALDLGDHLQVALSPKLCHGGIPTNGRTELGPYTIVINHRRETPSNPTTPPVCAAHDLIAIAQKGTQGSACRGICGFCNHGVWATNGTSEQAVTDNGWMRADII